METSMPILIELDGDGNVTDWNDVIEALSSFQCKEVLGKSLLNEFITEDYQQLLQEALDQCLATGCSVQDVAVPIFSKSGCKHDLSFRIQPLVNADHGHLGTSLVAHLSRSHLWSGQNC